MVDYQVLIEEIYNELRLEEPYGILADYIPELAKVKADSFGISVHDINGQDYFVGDSHQRFSIQSIAKVFSLSLVYNKLGEALWQRVGVEPSGNPFNSLVQLEYEKGKPRNPFINPGAIVICDIMLSEFDNPATEVLDFVRTLSGEPSVDYNAEVAHSEKLYGFKNAAHINLMKSFGNIENEVDEVLDLYYQLCSLEMSVVELAKSFSLFVNHGLNNGKRYLSLSKTKRLNALMQTCGFYDEAGEFSFRVGLPGKSGVGGGIVAVHPAQYSVAVWSPRLNKKGNSYLGMKVLENLTSKTNHSIF
jgi:glutaminase